MSDRNYELELYKLINTPYVNEFRWENSRFLIWVNYNWFKEFIEELTSIFSYTIFDDGNFNVNLQHDTVCINLSCVLNNYVDIEEIFPKTNEYNNYGDE